MNWSSLFHKISPLHISSLVCVSVSLRREGERNPFVRVRHYGFLNESVYVKIINFQDLYVEWLNVSVENFNRLIFYMKVLIN